MSGRYKKKKKMFIELRLNGLLKLKSNSDEESSILPATVFKRFLQQKFSNRTTATTRFNWIRTCPSWMWTCQPMAKCGRIVWIQSIRYHWMHLSIYSWDQSIFTFIFHCFHCSWPLVDDFFFFCRTKLMSFSKMNEILDIRSSYSIESLISQVIDHKSHRNVYQINWIHSQKLFGTKRM